MEPTRVADVGRPTELLDPDHRARLKSAGRKAERAQAELRQVVADLVAEGAPVAAIARALDVTRQTVYNWTKP